MQDRQTLIPYALEAVARPGSREICVRYRVPVWAKYMPCGRIHL